MIRPDDLDLAIEAIESGELVILPTQRWYMICADASDHEACARIFTGKSRPQSKPLALVLPHADLANDLSLPRRTHASSRQSSGPATSPCSSDGVTAATDGRTRR
jgi:tRNA A37 threonylcarbamoyladenosine synthetase subunit TsaC/SUA5/YrdC